MNLADFGYLRIAACSPAVQLADPLRNADHIALSYQQLSRGGAALVLFPELCISGYTCEDLFHNDSLLHACRQALGNLAQATRGRQSALVVSAPWRLQDGRLLNCTFVCAGGRVVGAVPKSFQPNYAEFYDLRWFVSGAGLALDIEDTELGRFHLGVQQLFQLGPIRFGIEICEDLWVPDPPGNALALAGADLILNPSASNELVAKADYRRDLVRMASAQRICTYLYASSGVTESTKDLVFGGHLIASENGLILAESDRFAFDAQTLSVDMDWQQLRHDRSRNHSFAASPRPAPYHVSDTGLTPAPLHSLQRDYPRHPFVPTDEHEVDARAADIMAIQATGLGRRLLSIGEPGMVIGLSGGLDSTLAYLVCLETLRRLDWPAERLIPLTLPGPGTSARTLESVQALCEATGTRLTTIPIDTAVAQHLKDLGQPPDQFDVVFENAQARERTQILFNYANKVGGIVVGTGDLSELALGWCTYNADQMANYNVNASVPKTLIAYLVRWFIRHRSDQTLSRVLSGILETPISPELLPLSESGEVTQTTESIIGPYELHDFFLYHFVRNGFGPRKILHLAGNSFSGTYDDATLRKWLTLFIRRFISQQFKRTALPPGPKVGSVSLSPRGDWRMPDEATARTWLAELEPPRS